MSESLQEFPSSARGDWLAPFGSAGRLRHLASLLGTPQAITREGLVELALGVERICDALEQIEMWPFDVGHTAERDLRDIRAHAAQALGGKR